MTDIAREQEHQSSGAKHRRTDTRRLATEEYLAHLAEGDITPSRFARIIGRIRSLLRDILRLPLRIGDRDIAYLLWLSKHRLQKTRTAAEAVAATATERRIRKQLFGRSENVRYRAIFDDATPENIERYSIERYIREHHITGVLLGEHNADDFAMRVYGLLDDMGRAIIDRMGNDRLKAMRQIPRIIRPPKAHRSRKLSQHHRRAGENLTPRDERANRALHAQTPRFRPLRQLPHSVAATHDEKRTTSAGEFQICERVCRRIA